MIVTEMPFEISKPSQLCNRQVSMHANITGVIDTLQEWQYLFSENFIRNSIYVESRTIDS